MNEQQQRALAEGLRALAATTKQACASPAVEAAVMAEFPRVSGAAAAARPAGARRAWLAIAAALVIASASGAWLSQRHGEAGNRQGRPGDFLEIPGAAYLPPLESAAVVRVAIPVSALPSYGIPIGNVTTDSVDADLLIAQDGLVRGIRLVNNSQFPRSTP